VEIGQSVRSSEPLGDMGSTQVNISSLTNHGVPVLYVEFRHRNEPVDPSLWWSNRGQDMQAKVGTQ
jgi:septal ring factor EnvC (AmiA/AmiB activator)